MSCTKEAIAALFSNGTFEAVFDHLSDGVVWTVIGERVFDGKDAVVQNCKQTAAYFKTVDTTFITNAILVSDNKVIAIGTAEFKRDGKRIQFVSACDVYAFDDAVQILKIDSYCIQDQTK